MKNKIRVLVADDSALMRLMISDILNSDERIRVIATAKDGEDGIKKVTMLKPDVVTMDIEMPNLDGLQALGYIMSEVPTPVVMLSAYTLKGAEATFRALEYGAVDFVTKPSGVISRDIAKIGSELIAKVKMAAEVNLDNLKFLFPKNVSENYIKPEIKGPGEKVIAIGSSTGGPRALTEILSQLDPDIPAGILIVQHMAKGFTGTFAARLNRESKIEVKEAEAGDRIEAGKALLAPGDYHMTVKSKTYGKGTVNVVSLNQDSPVYGLRPTVDSMMLSAAEVYRDKTIGVILTGMGSDGVKGMKAIKEKKGKTVSQDKNTCIVYGMPRAVVEGGVVDRVVPLDRIAEEIMKMV